MKLSELIEQAQEALNDYGDLDVTVWDDEWQCNYYNIHLNVDIDHQNENKKVFEIS